MTKDKGNTHGGTTPGGRLVVITGLAGAGYSTAIDALQDAGYLAVDNLPVALVSSIVSTEVETAQRKLAVSIDARTKGFDANELAGLLGDIRKRLGARVRMVFLTAGRDEIFRRFNATRRHHPLNTSGEAEGLMEAIDLDWKRMAPLTRIADCAIDTTATAPSDFKPALLAALGEAAPMPVPVTVESFSYRKGVPSHADMVLDMRFLNNPHWEEGLADKTGLDAEVTAFVEADAAFAPALDNIMGLLGVVLPPLSREGRPRFAIAIGCTGGRHRSVCVATHIARRLEDLGHPVRTRHRDLG